MRPGEGRTALHLFNFIAFFSSFLFYFFVYLPNVFLDYLDIVFLPKMEGNVCSDRHVIVMILVVNAVMILLTGIILLDNNSWACMK